MGYLEQRPSSSSRRARSRLEKMPTELAFLSALADSASGGFGDEALGHITALGRRPDEDYWDVYNRSVEGSRGRLEGARRDRPVTSFIGSGAGFFVPGGLITKGARALRAGPRLAQYASGILTGGAYGAGSGEDLGERAIGGAAGAALGAGGTYLGERIGTALGLVGRGGRDATERAARLMLKNLRNSTAGEEELVRRFMADGMTRPQARNKAAQLLEAGEDVPLEPRDLQLLANSLKAQGGSIQEMVLDAAPTLTTQAAGVVSAPGPGQGIIGRALKVRRQGVAPRRANAQGVPGMRGRMLEQAQASFAPQQTRSPRDFFDFRRSLKEARRGQAREAYSASRQEEIPDDALALLLREMDDGSVAETAAQMAASRARAVQKRLGAAQRRGADTTELEAEAAAATEARDALQRIAAGKGSNADITARTVEYYDRALGQKSFDAGRGTPLGVDLADVQHAFRELADEAAPALAQARSAYRHSMRTEELLNAGRKALTLGAGEIDDLLRGPNGGPLATEHADAFLVGTLEAVDDALGRNDVSAVRRLMGNANWRESIERAIVRPGLKGQELTNAKRRAQQFFARLARESGMQDSASAIQTGSRTTPLAEEVRSLTVGENAPGFLSTAAEKAAQAVQGGWLAALPKIASGVIDFLTPGSGMRFLENLLSPGIRNPQVHRELARMLTTRVTPEKMARLRAILEAEQARGPITPFVQDQARRVGALGRNTALGISATSGALPAR